MAYFERVRDVVSGPYSPDIIQQRMAAGWQMVSIEWRRELPDSEAPPEGGFGEDIPYGLRISDDCQRLEVHPTENQALMLMMDLLARTSPTPASSATSTKRAFAPAADNPGAGSPYST